jgi:hypothetical protein
MQMKQLRPRQVLIKRVLSMSPQASGESHDAVEVSSTGGRGPVIKRRNVATSQAVLVYLQTCTHFLYACLAFHFVMIANNFKCCFQDRFCLVNGHNSPGAFQFLNHIDFALKAGLSHNCNPGDH